MEIPTCERCHLNGVERQSEEILCETCWKGNGHPPFYAGHIEVNEAEEESESENEEDETDEIDQSFRFASFSTPSILTSGINQTASATTELTTVSQQPEVGEGEGEARPRPSSWPNSFTAFAAEENKEANKVLNNVSDPVKELTVSTSLNQEVQEAEAPSPVLPHPLHANGTPSLNLGHGIESEKDNATQSTQGDILYADLLIKYLVKKKDKGNKDQLKWNGNLTELQDFVTLVLKLTGNWKQSKVGGRPKADQPQALKHTFQDKKTNVTLNWWSSSKTLNLQGGQDQIASIEKTIASFLVNTIPDSSVQFSSDMTDTNESKQNSSSQDKGNQVNPSESEIKNIWKVIENLKAQLTVLNSNLMKNVRTAQNTDTQENVSKITCEKTEKHSKEKINLNESDSNLTATKPSTSDKVLKQKSVTEFFKPIKDEEYNRMNEMNALIVRIHQLEQEKKALVQQVDEMKQELNSLKSQNTNPTPKNKKKNPKEKQVSHSQHRSQVR